MNRFQLIGAIVVLSAALDAAIAYFVLPPDWRIYLYGAAAVTALIGLAFFLRGLSRP
jgi:hypothetical protein